MDLPENHEIDALVPEYTDEGDATHIYLRDGRDFLVPTTLRTTLKNLFSRSCRDLPRLRAWTAQRTHQRQNNPLPLDEDLVLCPFKVREPRVRGDVCMCCINVASGVTLAPGTASVLVTPGGHEIPTLWSRTTAQRHIERGALITLELQHLLDIKRRYHLQKFLGH